MHFSYIDQLSKLILISLHFRPAVSGLETYMSYVEKVLKAKKYFENHSPNSKELKEIVSSYILFMNIMRISIKNNNK